MDTTKVREEVETNNLPGLWAPLCLINTLTLISYDVDLEARVCSCLRWQVIGIPDAHALVVLRKKRLPRKYITMIISAPKTLN